MKNKLLIICAIILFSLTSACSCSNKKSVDDKKIQKIGVFEVKETKTENVDGSLKLNISLKNTSEDNLKIVDIENPGGQKVDKNMSTNFEINTGIQYSAVTKIKYKTTK